MMSRTKILKLLVVMGILIISSCKKKETNKRVEANVGVIGIVTDEKYNNKNLSTCNIYQNVCYILNAIQKDIQ